MKREKVIGPSDTIENAKWARAKPGQESKDGFRGRLGIREVLEMSDGIRDLIMKNSTASDLERLAKEEGMTTMLEDGIVKAAQGLTTVEEVLRVISD